MNWHGLKIYYAISGVCGVATAILFHTGLFAVGFGFLYLAIYWFGCGVSDGIDDIIYELRKEKKSGKNKERN